MMPEVLLVCAGAAVGAPLRLVAAHYARVSVGVHPLVGTMLVNVIGSFVLGLVVGSGIHANWVVLVGTGFCGALTTFSTLALELWDAFSDGRRGEALANVTLSLALGLTAAWAGYALIS